MALVSPHCVGGHVEVELLAWLNWWTGVVAERERHTYPHSPWSGKGGVDVGGGAHGIS